MGFEGLILLGRTDLILHTFFNPMLDCPMLITPSPPLFRREAAVEAGETEEEKAAYEAGDDRRA